MAQLGANPGMGRPGPIPRLAKDKEEAEYLSTDPDAGEEIETSPEQYRQPQGFLETYGAMATGESEGLEAQGRAGLTGLGIAAPAIGLPLATAAAPVLATKAGMGLTAAALALASGSSVKSAAAQSVAAGLGIPWAANTTLGRKILQGVARKLLGAEAAAAPAAAVGGPFATMARLPITGAAEEVAAAPALAAESIGARVGASRPTPSVPWRPPVGKAAPNAAAPPPVAPKPAAPKAAGTDFPRVGKGLSDGRIVRSEIPNEGSIGASLEPGYKVLPEVRDIPLSEFTLSGKSYSVSETKRIAELAAKIKQSGEINPLIVVKDAEGYYILEGGHRAEALFSLGAKKMPAKVVLDVSVAPARPLAETARKVAAKAKAAGAEMDIEKLLQTTSARLKAGEKLADISVRQPNTPKVVPGANTIADQRATAIEWLKNATAAEKEAIGAANLKKIEEMARYPLKHPTKAQAAYRAKMLENE